MDQNSNQNANGVMFEFNYADLILEPYTGTKSTSAKLLKEVIQKCNERDFPPANKLIDRHRNRSNAERRRLVLISAPMEREGKRCFGRMALIKNKAPFLWKKGTDFVMDIEKEENQEFLEITNFSIDFTSKNDVPIIMVEFNHAGPRISDLEYFFRQIAKQYRIAKSIRYIPHLNVLYGDLSSKISNVFKINVKVNNGLLAQRTDRKWLQNLRNIKTETGFKEIAMELFFSRAKDESGKKIKNILGLEYARDMIDWLRKDRNNIDLIEDLKMEYQVDDKEEPEFLDFLKNKTTSIVFVRFTTAKKYTLADYKHQVGNEFNHYLSTGKTNKHPEQ